MSSDGDIRVLHVDDEPELADVTAMHLERIDENITVVAESSARDGLERLRATPIDCVVSDHDMAELNGLEFLKAVREEYPELPFILFTGKGNEEIASDAISAGVTEYLQKDVGIDQYTVLANRIERAVGEQRAKAALKESERQLSTLISNLPGMVYQCKCERDWPMEFVSDGTRELVGYDAEAIESGEVSWQSLIVDDNEEIWERVQTCVDAGESFELRYRVRTSDGDIRWMWERGQAVGTTDGVELLEGFITDITARKERERELEREREFTENLVDTLDDVFYLLDPDGNLIRWNDTMAGVTGYSDEELSQMTAFDLVPESFHDRIEAAIERTIENGQATVELPIERKDGERRRHEMREARIEDGRGELVGVAGIGRDITEQRARERKLEQYETIVEAVGDPVYTLDEDGVFTLVNEAIEPMTGYSPEELVGEHIEMILPDEDLDRGGQFIRELLGDPDTDSGTFEMEIVTDSGERIPTENNLALLPSPEGTFSGTAGVIRDINERKEREQRLSEFASVVSHDLRNPLNVVQGRLELTQETGDMSHLDDAAEAAGRMERLIDDLLTLARQGEIVGTIDHVELATAAEAAWATVDTAGESLRLEAPGTVEADPARFRELLENLFHNSVEHGSTGERAVTVTVGSLDDGFYVADNGPGIPPEERGDVFERGYTTSDGGTGFGLAIVSDIAAAHGWSVELTESDTGGVRFEFRTSPADR